MDPSYIPARLLGLTDRMTFFQRVLNCIGHIFERNRPYVPNEFDKLKLKHNIKPEISTFESLQQARMNFFLGSFGFEYPRPMQPNTIYVLYSVGADSNQTVMSLSMLVVFQNVIMSFELLKNVICTAWRLGLYFYNTSIFHSIF